MGLLRRWRLVTWLLAAPVLLVLFGGQPYWTSYGALPAPLQAQAQAVLDRAGAPDVGIAVLEDGSACAAGTVHGLGPTSVLILNRATLDRPAPELLWAVAHEARHHLRYDPLLGAAFGWLWLGLMLAVSALVPALVRRRWPRIPAAPVVIAGFALGYGVGLPAFNLIQRQVERAADLYAAEVTSPAAGIAFIAHEAACFGQDYSPTLYDRLFRLNHPPPGERIAAMGALPTPPDTPSR